MEAKTVDVWVTCDGKWIDTSGMPEAERAMVKACVNIYWSTVCPEVPALAIVGSMDWRSFGLWWIQEFKKRGFEGLGKSALSEICWDIETRIGIHEGKVVKPKPFVSSYWPFWA